MPRTACVGAGQVVACGGAGFLQQVRELTEAEGVKVLAFEGGEQCRAHLKEAGGNCSLVLIGPSVVDVAPINLLAAVCRDASLGGSVNERLEGGAREDAVVPPFKVVLLTQGEPSGSLSSRARSAGAQAVLREEDLAQCVNLLPRAAAATGGEHAAVGSLISVVSASGGSGKSTLALLLAMALSERGMNAGLVDFSLRFGCLDRLLGLEDVRRVDELLPALGGGVNVASSLASIGNQMPGETLLYAAMRKPEVADQIAAHTGELVQAFRARHEVCVFDTGGGWGGEQVELMRASSRVLLVLDQRSGGLEAAEDALNLCMRLDIPLARMLGVVNRAGKHSQVDEVSASVALRGIDVVSVEEGTREVDELVGLGCPQELFLLRNPCAQGVRHLVDLLMPALRGAGAPPSASSEREDATPRRGRMRFLRRDGAEP